MKIGSIVIDNNTVLAPLAGITNLPFRLIAKKAGCGLVCSEMVSANGIAYGSKKTLNMLDSLPEEHPVSFQIFGSDPFIMAEAAIIVESFGTDIIDINFGCSVKKVVKTGAGVALMKEPGKAEAILKAVKNRVKIPVTIKIRTGWEKSGEQALATAKIAEYCGIDAIAVHPRTASQGFRGTAEWSVISRVKEHVSIPVIGNGDILTAYDAVSMLDQTGCDAVMVGRAAIGNPMIFGQINALMAKEPLPPASIAQRFNCMKEYLTANAQYFGEKQACFMMRSRLGWFVKGLDSNSKFRESIKHITSEQEAIDIINSYYDFLIAKMNI